MGPAFIFPQGPRRVRAPGFINWSGVAALAVLFLSAAAFCVIAAWFVVSCIATAQVLLCG